MEFMKIGDEIKEVSSCIAVPVPGLASWINPKMQHKAVLLKGAEEFKVNTLLRVKGVLEEFVDNTETTDTVHAIDMLDSLYSEWSKLPVFHIQEYKLLSQTDLLPKDLQSNDLQNARNLMLDLLTNVLIGDELAAEFLLIHILSKVYNFFKSQECSEGINLEQISGYMPLNLCNISKDQGKHIKDTLSSLLPFVNFVQLTLENLNNVYQFLPEMVQGNLRPGMLQVCDSTLMILDETAMETGTLQERGLVNLSNLRNVMQTAILPFLLAPECSMEMPVDIKFLVLSEGKTLLPVDCVVPVVKSQEKELDIAKFNSSLTEWEQLRGYINSASNMSYSVPEDTAERIVKEFASVAANGRKLNGQDLVRRLETARLLSKSMGKTALEYSVWQKSVEMDEMRMDRLDAKKEAALKSKETLLR